MAKKKKKEPFNPDVPMARVHAMGKWTGYKTDGESRWVAPSHKDSYDKIADAENGINDLIRALNDDFLRRREVIAGQRRQWWAHLAEDLGLKEVDGWSYSPRDGRLYKTPIAKPEDSER